MVSLLKTSRAVMINLNLNPNDTPKWAVIRPDTPKSQIYCENPLLESERHELENRLGFLNLEEVSPGNADFLISTGYSAIAWLDQNITHGWNFDTNADFNVLFGDYSLLIFNADSSGVHFKSVNNEYDIYFTEGLKAINRARYGITQDPPQDPPADSKLWGAFSLYRMSGLATIGEIEGEQIPYNDVAKVIEVVGRHRLSHQQFEYYSGLGFRSKIPRFSQTLIDLNMLQEHANQVTLTIPESIDYSSVKTAHAFSCGKTSTDSALLRFIKRNPGSTLEPKSVEIATGMVLTVFRTRAKVPKLEILLPTPFQLNRQEQQMIVRLMQDNAYVTELSINDKNVSLKELKAELLPVFARNRWLHENNYLPPFYDNYWLRAAKYWLIHLASVDDILEEKSSHILFKGCVEEMGVVGLKAVLNYLSDPESSERLLSVYGTKRPAFYMACQKQEVNAYLDLFINHLKEHAPFPFAKIGVAYQPGQDHKYLELIKYINQVDSFENIQISGCLRHKREFAVFLQLLAAHVQEGKWTGLIVIPELEDKKMMAEEYRELHVLYRQLNNIILNNRHLKQGAVLANRIKESSEFHELTMDSKADATGDLEETALDLTKPLFAASETGPWPLKRGGAVQLQIQQQQEIQQTRQIQQEHQRMVMHMEEQVITSVLVTYQTIDKVFGEYYERYKEENRCDESYAALWNKDNETILKGFYHTWINSNPEVRASSRAKTCVI